MEKNLLEEFKKYRLGCKHSRNIIRLSQIIIFHSIFIDHAFNNYISKMNQSLKALMNPRYLIFTGPELINIPFFTKQFQDLLIVFILLLVFIRCSNLNWMSTKLCDPKLITEDTESNYLFNKHQLFTKRFF